MTEFTANEIRKAASEINELAEMESMAETIAANSDDYDSTDDVIEDYPTEKSLKTKLDVMGPVVTQVANSEDSDDLPMFGGDAE